MIDTRHIAVFDFETGSADKTSCEILQVGAAIINSRNFKVIDKYETLMKPKDFDALEDEALAVNGLTREQLEDAPDVDIVFPSWCEWVRKHNTRAVKTDTFGAPIPCGWGIDNFDMPIMERYCSHYDFWDKKWNNQNVMNPIFTFDVMKFMWLLTRKNPECKNLKLVGVLEYMGVPKSEIQKGAHDALWDVIWTAKIAQKLLKLGISLTEVNAEGNRRLNIKGVFANEFS